MRSVRWQGHMSVCHALGTPVVTDNGARVGVIADFAVDVAADLRRPPVTQVVIRHRGDRRVVPWTGLAPSADNRRLVCHEEVAPFDEVAVGELLVREDILDAPVVLFDPPARARVSDVLLEADAHGARVVGLDVSTSTVFRRLLSANARSKRRIRSVPLTDVHLASPAAHAAQLAIPEALVFRLGPSSMAEVLTRLSVAHGREILEVADPAVLSQALARLHPHVRARLSGAQPAARRTRRLAGWRVHHPRPGPDGE